jgi:uncharacterized OB-fold protein
MSAQLPPSPAQTYQSYLQQNELWLQWCIRCARQIFFPRTLCPHCGSRNLDWRRASGQGIVYSTTTVRQRPERGGDYNIAIIELTEGARMLSRVEGVASPDVRIGMTVEAVIVQQGETRLVTFRPRQAQS